MALRSLLPGVLLSLSILLALSAFAAPAAAAAPPRPKRGLVDLNAIPDNSVSTWLVVGPPGLRKESTPPQFKVTGPIVIDVLRVIRPQFTPIRAEWLSSNLSSDPSTWTALVAPPAGPNIFANLTLENPGMRIWGGRFNIENSTSDYSFKPKNTELTFSRVSGSLLQSDVDKQNVVVTVPPANAPTLSGKFIRRGKIFELLSTGSFDVPLGSLVDTLGGPPGPPGPPGAAAIRVNLNLQGIGQQPSRAGGPGRAYPPPGPPAAQEPPPLADVPSAAPPSAGCAPVPAAAPIPAPTAAPAPAPTPTAPTAPPPSAPTAPPPPPPPRSPPPPSMS